MKTTTVLDLIGNTPLIALSGHNIVAKAELLNPGGSIKDRVALAMIESAEREGVLKPGDKIVEPTSGNTGIGVTMVGVAKGYEVYICMPHGMSKERRDIIKAFGGRLILTPDEESVGGAVHAAEKFAEEHGAFMPQQFKNPHNPKAHYEFTGPELWRQTGGNIDAFVAGIGSGGTMQGVGTFLREHNPAVKLFAVEPANRSAILGHEPGLHRIQGIGDGFIPDILDVSLINEVIEVTDDQAIETTRELARTNSLLVGTSSGANVWAARRVAERYPGKMVATILADRAERYFSTGLLTPAGE
ncbi:MAG: cysteine synthase A [Chitinivibrionales bacterium]|nr:cysteine synthase A [Chitinivibrionales bacterium]MBD3355772.1 cysteine synthase A [Chitinivibrionales bacterium]